MAVLNLQPYGQFPSKLANKEVDLDADNIRVTLHTSSYMPNADMDAYVSDLNNELASGGGYTPGGVAMTSLSRSYVPANSWGFTAAISTNYAVGDVRIPAGGNGFLYECAVAGASAGSPPTWPTTVGREVVDGSVVWSNAGLGAFVFNAAPTIWSTFTATGIRYAVLSDRSTGVAATEPLIGYGDFGTDTAGSAGDFSIEWDATGVLLIFRRG